MGMSRYPPREPKVAQWLRARKHYFQFRATVNEAVSEVGGEEVGAII